MIEYLNRISIRSSLPLVQICLPKTCENTDTVSMDDNTKGTARSGQSQFLFSVIVGKVALLFLKLATPMQRVQLNLQHIARRRASVKIYFATLPNAYSPRAGSAGSSALTLCTLERMTILIRASSAPLLVLLSLEYRKVRVSPSCNVTL